MRKIGSVILAAVMAAGLLAGCGEGGADTEQGTAETVDGSAAADGATAESGRAAELQGIYNGCK